MFAWEPLIVMCDVFHCGPFGNQFSEEKIIDRSGYLTDWRTPTPWWTILSLGSDWWPVGSPWGLHCHSWRMAAIGGCHRKVMLMWWCSKNLPLWFFVTPQECELVAWTQEYDCESSSSSSILISVFFVVWNKWHIDPKWPQINMQLPPGLHLLISSQIASTWMEGECT